MSTSSDSDSSVEDSEEKKRLSEAVVSFVQHQIPVVTTPQQNEYKDISRKEKLGLRNSVKEKQSLRPSATDKDHECSAFPPGVQKFVATKLSEQLDREIELAERSNGIMQLTDDTGIQLFQTSTVMLKTDGETNTEMEIAKCKPKKRTYSSSSDSSEDERLAAAAVSPAFVMKHSALSIDSKSDTKDNEQYIVETSKKKKKKKKKHKEEIKVS